jgi:D-inositol-3-phosphate glycosyltransferase
MDAFLPRVERYDPMSRTALFRLLSRADVYLQPSVFESYGMAAAEAVALGVPVVASRVGGLSEAVRDGIDGVLCDRDDSACWNRALDAGAAGELPVPSGGHARTWESAAQALLRFLRML